MSDSIPYKEIMSDSTTEQSIGNLDFNKNAKPFVFIITVKELTYHGVLSKYLKAIQSRVFP